MAGLTYQEPGCGFQKIALAAWPVALLTSETSSTLKHGAKLLVNNAAHLSEVCVDPT